uniref:EMI domain-containing protein n=1 Tax=Electrophorus electricus TaxID=8005 RepID=A0A4W4FFY6_ELEEL
MPDTCQSVTTDYCNPHYNVWLSSVTSLTKLAPLTLSLSLSLSLSRNHCAYVVEKSMSYSVQDGAAPYVKAEYNKCGWGQKCPALMYQMFYKPMYKVAFKTVTELEWRCCPGFTGVACNVQPGAYGMKAMPPFKGPMSSNKGPQLFRKGPAPSYKGPMTSFKVERLNRMEEEVRHLSFGLETLRGKVTGLEDHLRAALREDANRMLSALLSAAPVPVVTPPLDSTVAFGDLPGGAPDMEHADVVGQFPRLAELTEKVAELHAELKAKSSELAELRWMVLDHDGALQRLSGGWGNQTDSQDLETLVEAKLREARVAILGGFEKRVVSAEEHCEGQATEVRLQCKKELMEGREQLEQDLNGSVAGFREELRKLHSQLQGLEPTETCYSAVSGVTERLVLLEQSMDGLNQSQMHLQAELGGHKDHVEGMLEGRLGYVEAQLSLTEKQLGGVGSEMSGIRLDACLEDKMRALESRLFAAVEELSNATAPALLEGQSVSLEVLCTSSCTSQPVLTGYDATLKQDETENHKNLHRKLEAQMERLDQLNATLNSLLIQLADTKVEEGLLGEVTLLKVSVHSVNRTLRGLKDSFGKVVQEVGRANLTWQEREERLAQQVKGVVHLVGQQASMLGAGERRLTRLRGELQDLRRRLGTELQGCRSTALGVRKEVTEVGGRVARVEDQCSGLARLAEDLELIRGELEKHMEGYLSQVNSTLVDHSVQLSVLRNGLRNCTVMSELTNTTDFTATQLWAETHTPEPAYPRGDQFIEPTQVEDVQELKYAP